MSLINASGLRSTREVVVPAGRLLLTRQTSLTAPGSKRYIVSDSQRACLPVAAMVYRLRKPRRMLSRRGDSSPSRSSSADAAAAEGEYRKAARRDRGDVDSGREAGGEEGVAAALSLPPLVRGGGEAGAARRRRPRHVSAFRERILEERRARKEVRRYATLVLVFEREFRI